jgi:hypothetical protein
MANVSLSHSRIRAGVWEAELRCEGAMPSIQVTHLDRPLGGVTLSPLQAPSGGFALRVPIPAESLSDGVQTFLICETETGAKIGHFTILAGAGLENDIRAEIDLLRAELDMLKKAFRRHCVETM